MDGAGQGEGESQIWRTCLAQVRWQRGGVSMDERLRELCCKIQRSWMPLVGRGLSRVWTFLAQFFCMHAYIHTYMRFTPHFMLLSHSNVYCRLLDPHSVSVDIMQHEPLVSALVNGWGMIALQSILYNHKLLLIVTGSLSVAFICYCCYYKKEKCVKVE